MNENDEEIFLFLVCEWIEWLQHNSSNDSKSSMSSSENELSRYSKRYYPCTYLYIQMLLRVLLVPCLNNLFTVAHNQC